MAGKKAIAGTVIGGGLNSSSDGELKLYLDWKDTPTSGNSFYYYIWIGIYSVLLVAIDTYLDLVQKMNFLLDYYWECNYAQIGSTSSYTIFGFCHDSLNSANSLLSILETSLSIQKSHASSISAKNWCVEVTADYCILD